MDRQEIKAFRTAIRMSVLEFAHKLGVADRIVTRWETGGAENIPTMVNQPALDTEESGDQDQGGEAGHWPESVAFLGERMVTTLESSWAPRPAASAIR